MTTRITALAFALAALAAAGSTSAATLTVEPTEMGPFDIGDSITFNVVTSSDFGGLGAIAFDLDLTYDADALDFSSAAVVSPLVLLTAVPPAAPNNPSGTTTIDTLSGGLFSGVIGGDQVIATFAFTAAAAGTTTVSLATLFVDGFADVVFDANAEGAAVVAGAAQVIPLPAPALLLPFALGALALPKLRRRRAAALPLPCGEPTS